jgi:hypothetical protein
VQVDAGLLPFLPLWGYRAVDVGLVDDLGYQLRSVLDEIRAGGRNLGAMNGICGTVFEEERDQSAEGIEEEGNYHEIDHQEGDGATPHGARTFLGGGGRRTVRRRYSRRALVEE